MWSGWVLLLFFLLSGCSGVPPPDPPASAEAPEVAEDPTAPPPQRLHFRIEWSNGTIGPDGGRFVFSPVLPEPPVSGTTFHWSVANRLDGNVTMAQGQRLELGLPFDRHTVRAEAVDGWGRTVGTAEARVWMTFEERYDLDCLPVAAQPMGKALCPPMAFPVPEGTSAVVVYACPEHLVNRQADPSYAQVLDEAGTAVADIEPSELVRCTLPNGERWEGMMGRALGIKIQEDKDWSIQWYPDLVVLGELNIRASFIT